MKKLIILLFAISPVLINAQKNAGEKKVGNQLSTFHTDIPAHLYDIILSRPTNHSITFSILTAEDLDGYISYGSSMGKLDSKSNPVHFTKGRTTLIELNSLEAGKRYYYNFVYKKAEESAYNPSEQFFFQTQRPVAASFSFTIQADSHLDENAGTEMYLRTLNNMAMDSADFLVDLGDTWMTDKYRNDYHESYKQYLAQRYYFGSLCHSSSLYLTLGNHDGEQGQQQKKRDASNMNAWSTLTRKQFYSNPYPADFYSGNEEKEAGIGYPENYYAWEWGNALFIVLDPFRYSAGNKDPWQRTLGEQQYNWLKRTLEKSHAAFKFVFIHNLVGGADLKGKGRGGAEASSYYEWGGMDTTGAETFSTQRPGWDKPIHDLLVANKVNVVFHGHDHFFAKQERDGLIYQLVPQPGALRYGNTNSAAEYGYRSGVIMNTPGYLRVSIKGSTALVEYLQSSTDPKHVNREILYTYSIPAK